MPTPRVVSREGVLPPKPRACIHTTYSLARAHPSNAPFCLSLLLTSLLTGIPFRGKNDGVVFPLLFFRLVPGGRKSDRQSVCGEGEKAILGGRGGGVGSQGSDAQQRLRLQRRGEWRRHEDAGQGVRTGIWDRNGDYDGKVGTNSWCRSEQARLAVCSSTAVADWEMVNCRPVCFQCVIYFQHHPSAEPSISNAFVHATSRWFGPTLPN